MKRKLIMDCDTGSDDAIAILTAILSNKFDILGICTAPLLPIEETTKNTLKILNLLKSEIPVYRGVSCPLVKTLSPIRRSRMVFNQPINIDGKQIRMHMPFDLREGNQKEEKKDAASFYVETLKNTKERITIMISGPCSNLAMALNMNPTIVNNIEEIVIMGGGYLISNISPAAESNFFRDPEAAQIVLNCEAKITLMPLDATHEASFSQIDIEKLRIKNNPIADFVYRTISERADVYHKTQPISSENGLLEPVHDALCIAYMVDPEIVTEFKTCRADVECSDSIADGKLNIDNRFYHANDNIKMALHTDRKKFVEFVIQMISKGENTYA